MSQPRNEEGMALVLVVVGTTLIMGLGLMLSLSTIVDADMSGHAHAALQTMALAEAAGERAMVDLDQLASWDPALAGVATSTFFDGATGGRLVAGETVNLSEETARLTCGSTSCAGRSPVAVTADRPWGVNNPQWTVFASGSSHGLLGAQPALLPGYAVVWVADDASETDGNALVDGGPPLVGVAAAGNPGADVLRLRIVAWGPRGSRRELDVVVERLDRTLHAGLRARAWREIRGAVP